MANDTLLHISGNSYAWSGKYTVGVYLHEETGSAYLLDSGPNQIIAEMIDREITKRGYEIVAIVHSHGHLMNTGGSHYFRKHYPMLRCYATSLSAPFINNPSLLAPIGTISHVQNSNTGLSMLEDSSIITDTIPLQDAVLEINGLAFTIYTLPGHFSGMVGIQTPDQVLYCADALFGSSTLSRQKLLFFTEPHKAKISLQKLKTIHAKQYVIFHGGVYNSISELIDENINRIDDAYDDVLALIEQQWQTSESITQRMMSIHDFENNEKQYDLAYTITQAYLKQLIYEGKISRIIKNGILFYKNNDV
ncbi:Glyoxylase, beta-lactamase superfamily II [Paenibacillus sp. 1_12]|uniref:MBL fold metallo-hydrolase n=1 Tax=Paenibacillus sp. 1_12 TaxID=1566278 RepID=UPI0008EA0EB9|nr:MBL fold metallo-hydrolase [Paenibacillus sp. 1_12]SFM28336.1 Glyoxylase, beta-lactamase superfamily II [Paenibacillus sp. 1_12]